MDKDYIKELWKKDKLKALSVLYPIYLKNAVNDINQLRQAIDFIEKEFKINLREYLDDMVKQSDKNINVINVALSGIILASKFFKGGKKDV